MIEERTLVAILRGAGERVIAVRNEASNSTVEVKHDNSIVTKADLKSQDYVLSEMSRLSSGVTVLSEEARQVETGRFPTIELVEQVPPEGSFASFDPLDGTAKFANGYSDVAISLGFQNEGSPYIGAIALPYRPLGVCALYAKEGEGFGYYDNLSGPKKWERLPGHEEPLKHCLLAADICASAGPEYNRTVINKLSPQFRYQVNTPTVSGIVDVVLGRAAAFVTANAKHWDLAAAHVILTEAGGHVGTFDGKDVPFDQIKLPSFIAARDLETYVQMVEWING